MHGSCKLSPWRACVSLIDDASDVVIDSHHWQDLSTSASLAPIEFPTQSTEFGLRHRYAVMRRAVNYILLTNAIGNVLPTRHDQKTEKLRLWLK